MKTLFKRLGVEPLVIELDELGMFIFAEHFYFFSTFGQLSLIN